MFLYGLRIGCCRDRDRQRETVDHQMKHSASAPRPDRLGDGIGQSKEKKETASSGLGHYKHCPRRRSSGTICQVRGKAACEAMMDERHHHPHALLKTSPLSLLLGELLARGRGHEAALIGLELMIGRERHERSQIHGSSDVGLRDWVRVKPKCGRRHQPCAE